MSEIKKYTHKVQYYETDQMGIVHHSIISAGLKKQEQILWSRWGLAMNRWRSGGS